MHTKCNYCNHTNSYHHIYCPIDSKELEVWKYGYSDALAEKQKCVFNEAAHNKIYELGYSCGKKYLVNKTPIKELVILEMISPILNKV